MHEFYGTGYGGAPAVDNASYAYEQLTDTGPTTIGIEGADSYGYAWDEGADALDTSVLSVEDPGNRESVATVDFDDGVDTSVLGNGPDYETDDPVWDIEDIPASDEPRLAPDARQEALDQFERWEQGETVVSGATEVCDFPVSETEEHILADMAVKNNGYTEITSDRLHTNDEAVQADTGLSEEQIATVAALGDRFLEAVKTDAAENGLGNVDETSLRTRVGRFDPGFEDLPWHVDRFHSPTSRYVLSLGTSGATQFAEGPITQGDVTRAGFVKQGIDTGPGGTHIQTTHGTGVVTRFPSDYGVHRTPDDAGFRLFFSVDAPLNPEAYLEMVGQDARRERL